MEWRLFADLAEVAGDRRVTVEPDSHTVRAALAELVEDQPALRERVLDGDEPTDYVTVLVEGEEVRDLDVEVPEDAQLSLLPPASGG